MDSQRRGRRFFLILVALFFVPLLSAAVLVNVWQPDSTVNHGRLLSPIQPLPPFQAPTLEGQPMNRDDLLHHWTLVWVGRTCPQACLDGLIQLRQIRFALGREQGRLKNVLLVERMDQPEGLRQWLQSHDPQVTAAIMPEILQQRFSNADGELLSGIYLLDPMANRVIRYDPSIIDRDPRGILKDLKRLFKYSKLG